MSGTKESSSPRTDAAADEAGCDDETGFYDICKFARQLERECAAYQKDAERYRWIRQAGAWESEIGMDILSEDPTKFDAEVDAARADFLRLRPRP